MIGLDDCVRLNLIKKVDHVKVNRPSTKTSSKVDGNSNPILEEYADLISGIGCINGTHDIKLKENVAPVVHASRKVPIALIPKLKAKLESLKKPKIIEKVQKPTDWVNSLVIVSKPNGELRLCIDAKELNQAIRRPHFQIPTFEEISSKMAEAKIFSSLDSKNGFWKICLTEQSSDLCTCNTPCGRYKFLRLPYGLCSASEVFQQKMKEMFENMEGVKIYIDNIIVWGRDQKEHDARLRQVLNRMRTENIKLNRDKCKIGISEIRYLGNKFSEAGLTVDENKVRAISCMEPPDNRKSLERFLGLVTYVSKFIPNVSELTAPL